MIILFSAKHTGTHFIWGLLCQLDEIPWPIGRGFPYINTVAGAYQRLFINGEITVDRFEDIFYDYEISCDRSKAYFDELVNLGFPVEPKDKEYDLQFHQIHYELNWSWDWTDKVRAIVPVRDPMLVILSALKRGWHDPDINLAALDYISRLKNVFFFPVDLWSNDKEKAFDMFDFLELKPNEAAKRFIAKWPKYGSIDNEQWRYEKYIGVEFRREIEDCVAWFECGKIHPLLDQPLRVIRGLGIQKFYQSLGYKDLIWFE